MNHLQAFANSSIQESAKSSVGIFRRMMIPGQQVLLQDDDGELSLGVLPDQFRMSSKIFSFKESIENDTKKEKLENQEETDHRDFLMSDDKEFNSALPKIYLHE